jgi:sensor histidine kinase YesM
MEKYPFIFSNEKKWRISRHLAFWLFWWAFQSYIYSFVASRRSNYWLCFKDSMAESAVYMLVHIFLAYTLMYFVVPKYLLKQRYWATAGWVILLTLTSAALAPILAFYVIEPIRFWILGELAIRINTAAQSVTPSTITIHLSLMAGLRGALTIAGMATAIKLMKHWYIKEQRNLQLQKENMAAQMQLLKAQIHPHFLFNTLNNIYSHTQNVSPTGSKLLMGLSDMLRYILHEGSKQKVPLSGELQMIEDYMMLEQIRYGNRLEINKVLPSDTNNLVVAPLILLPFVENCFKHGTSNMLDKAWIRLAIDIDGNKMKMTLVNAKLSEDQLDKKEPSGIGISNVKKRLDLLYKDKCELSITEEEDVYIVNLWIELERNTTVVVAKEVKEMVHA